MVGFQGAGVVRMRFLRMLRYAGWKGNSESVGAKAGKYGACLEDRKGPVGLE